MYVLKCQLFVARNSGVKDPGPGIQGGLRTAYSAPWRRRKPIQVSVFLMFKPIELRAFYTCKSSWLPGYGSFIPLFLVISSFLSFEVFPSTITGGLRHTRSAPAASLFYLFIFLCWWATKQNKSVLRLPCFWWHWWQLRQTVKLIQFVMDSPPSPWNLKSRVKTE